MKICLMMLLFLLSTNSSIACEKEFYDINLDKAENSIKIISNGRAEDFYSKFDNIKFPKDLRIHKQKEELYSSKERVYSYHIENNFNNTEMYSGDKYSMVITYPNGKELEVFYEYMDLTKEENLNKFRVIPSSSNIQSFLIPAEKEDELDLMGWCVSTLRYYIEYN